MKKLVTITANAEVSSKYFWSQRRKENDDIAFFSSQSLLFGGK
jgi:hypothetical protein